MTLPGAQPLPFTPPQDRMLTLWDDRRGDRRWPARADFEVDDFQATIGRVLLLDVEWPEDAGRVYRYRLFGTWVVEEIGQDLTGLTTGALTFDWQRGFAHRIYDRVCETGGPVACIRWQIGAQFLAGHVLLALPLGGDRVDMILTLYGPIPASRHGRRRTLETFPIDLLQLVYDVDRDASGRAAGIPRHRDQVHISDAPPETEASSFDTGAVPICHVPVTRDR